MLKECNDNCVVIQIDEKVTVIPQTFCVGVIQNNNKAFFPVTLVEKDSRIEDSINSYMNLQPNVFFVPLNTDAISDPNVHPSTLRPIVANEENDNKDTTFAKDDVYVRKDHTNTDEETDTLKRDQNKNKIKPMGDGRYHCVYCTKHYADRKALSQHSRLHDPEYDGCHICGKKFARKTFLEDHIRTHTGEKPFGCHICGKYFRCKRNLAQHKTKGIVNVVPGKEARERGEHKARTYSVMYVRVNPYKKFLSARLSQKTANTKQQRHTQIKIFP
ncbi:zinc finger protein [Reticulomyxa filosa]|uniref:Zinc finger protein n=1 Tax=Reticulomyxa filosa TaxID=46433 RepID=X6NQM2_RETFI|nr:zinc finger protein [Reticulomyxa filosa]|eukprot:ETO27662.1 zinc finger protein [Reticulomyxa filosa]